eukprot:4795116-Pleurochrysis_carterae.AAC.2
MKRKHATEEARPGPQTHKSMQAPLGGSGHEALGLLGWQSASPTLQGSSSGCEGEQNAMGRMA